jgi:hypothetical protein
LDPSQKTGWALYDTKSEKLSTMRCGVIKAEGEKKTPLALKAASLGPQLLKLIKADRPDFVAVESPPQKPYGGKAPSKKPRFVGEDLLDDEDDGNEGGGGQVTGLKGVISTNDCATALVTIIRCYGIPAVLLKDSTWRKSAYGFGTRTGWTRPDWKQHARSLCRQHNISATNDDAAEACWIAYAGGATQTFRKMENDAAEAARMMQARAA